MPRLIKQLQNNRSVIFDSGKFDDWCVYVVESNGSKKAPFDETYFSDLHQISQSYPNNKVYNDFVKIYERTTRTIENGVLTLIDEIVRSEEHTSELQSRPHLVCRLLLEKKKKEKKH